MEDNDFLKLVGDVLGMQMEEVSLEDSLESVGWDSLSSLEFIALADRKYGFKIAGDSLADARTIGDLRKTFVA